MKATWQIVKHRNFDMTARSQVIATYRNFQNIRSLQAWFLSSAAKQLRTALFWVVIQREWWGDSLQTFRDNLSACGVNITLIVCYLAQKTKDLWTLKLNFINIWWRHVSTTLRASFFQPLLWNCIKFKISLNVCPEDCRYMAETCCRVIMWWIIVNINKVVYQSFIYLAQGGG